MQRYNFFANPQNLFCLKITFSHNLYAVYITKSHNLYCRIITFSQYLTKQHIDSGAVSGQKYHLPHSYRMFFISPRIFLRKVYKIPKFIFAIMYKIPKSFSSKLYRIPKFWAFVMVARNVGLRAFGRVYVSRRNSRKCRKHRDESICHFCIFCENYIISSAINS